MVITEQDQLSTDLDWFAVDRSGYIGHFGTAGFKKVPPSVARSAEDLKAVTTYFRLAAPVTGPAVLSSALTSFVPELGGKIDKRRYTESFRFMAERGVFSFDVETYLRPETVYFLVAAPTVPVHMKELPAPVRAILCRTALPTSELTDCFRIAYQSTLAL